MRDVLAIAYQTVDVFGQITGKPLTLKDSSAVRTDGRTLYAPFEDPNLYTLVEKLLAHVVFESNARALEEMVLTYSRAISRNTGIDASKIRPLVRSICEFLNESRVIGLWGQLYPGSEIDLRELLHEQTTPSPPPSTIANLLRALSGGHAPCGPHERYAPVLVECLGMVEGKDFGTVLIATKWLFNQLVDELLKGHFETDVLPDEIKNDPRSRSQALEALTKIGADPKTRPSDLAQTKYASDAEKSQARKQVHQALSVSVRTEELHEALNRSALRAATAVTAVQNTIVKNSALRRKAKAKVMFVDVPAGITVLDARDLQTVRKLKAASFRILGRKSHTLDYEGGEIDALAAVQRMVTKQDAPVFRVERSGRGFRALVLLDRSHSMTGVKTQRAERACKIIGKALDFPFVDCRTWGFQSPGPGEVLITRYASEPTESKCGGTTPLHVAIHVAVKHLLQYQDVRQLVVVSDGAPIWPDRTACMMDTEELMELTRTEVIDARRRGVSVTGVFIHRKVHGHVDSELTPKDMEFMFGSPRHWKMIADDDFDSALVRLMSRSFHNYLRSM